MTLATTSPTAAITAPQYQTCDQLFAAYEQAKLELLMADAAVSEQRRAFYADGITTCAAERQSLYAKQDRLRAVAQSLKIQAMAAKQSARTFKGKTFLEKLIELAVANGQDKLVEKARQASVQALADAGLTHAYRF